MGVAELLNTATQEQHGTLLTRKEAAEFLGYSEQTLAIWKCVNRYPLPYLKIGRKIRYKLADLQHFKMEFSLNR